MSEGPFVLRAGPSHAQSCFVVPWLVMASHSFRCVINIDTSCPRQEPKLQKDGDDDAWSVVSGPTDKVEVSRAMINWKRILKRLARIRRLRKYWAYLGHYLQQYSALKPPSQPKVKLTK